MLLKRLKVNMNGSLSEHSSSQSGEPLLNQPIINVTSTPDDMHIGKINYDSKTEFVQQNESFIKKSHKTNQLQTTWNLCKAFAGGKYLSKFIYTIVFHQQECG